MVPEQSSLPGTLQLFIITVNLNPVNLKLALIAVQIKHFVHECTNIKFFLFLLTKAQQVILTSSIMFVLPPEVKTFFFNKYHTSFSNRL